MEEDQNGGKEASRRLSWCSNAAQQITIKLAAFLSNRFIVSEFLRIWSWVQHGWILCSEFHKAEIKVLAFFLETLGKKPLPSSCNIVIIQFFTAEGPRSLFPRSLSAWELPSAPRAYLHSLSCGSLHLQISNSPLNL